jgi:hypothetical protein
MADSGERNGKKSGEMKVKIKAAIESLTKNFPALRAAFFPVRFVKKGGGE